MCRRSDPASLARQFRGDLQWIVQKALEKEPDARYVDVHEFAADLERFLRHEPLMVAQPGVAYRTRKFIVRHRLQVSAVAIMLVALGLGFGASRFLSATNEGKAIGETVHGTVEVQALTHSGDAWDGVISPDGRYVVFLQEPAGQLGERTFWLADQATWGAERLPVPAVTGRPDLLGWSRNGQHLYYRVLNDQQDGTYTVYRYSLAEQKADKIRERATGSVLSPDEKHLAGVRNDPDTGRNLLFIEPLPGSSERIVATRPLDDPYNGSLAWSPDGRALSSSVGKHGTPQRVVDVEIEDGRERSLSVDRWDIAGAKVWLPDGRTLLMAGEKSADGEQVLLYRLDTSTGVSLPIETGLRNISGWKISASADGRTLAATHSWFSAKLFVMPDADSRRALEVGAAFADTPAFLPDDRLLFTGDDGHPWVVHPDGSKRRRFSDAVAGHAAASLDGRVLVMAKRHGGFLRLWRMPSDGSDLVPLADSRPAWHSDVSPDGRWVVYITGTDGALWKVAAAGGKPKKLLDGAGYALRIAPDGSSVAVFRQEPGNPWEIGVVPLEGGGLARRQAVPPGTSVSAGIHFANGSAAVESREN